MVVLFLLVLPHVSLTQECTQEELIAEATRFHEEKLLTKKGLELFEKMVRNKELRRPMMPKMLSGDIHFRRDPIMSQLSMFMGQCLDAELSRRLNIPSFYEDLTKSAIDKRPTKTYTGVSEETYDYLMDRHSKKTRNGSAAFSHDDFQFYLEMSQLFPYSEEQAKGGYIPSEIKLDKEDLLPIIQVLNKLTFINRAEFAALETLNSDGRLYTPSDIFIYLIGEQIHEEDKWYVEQERREFLVHLSTHGIIIPFELVPAYPVYQNSNWKFIVLANSSVSTGNEWKTFYENHKKGFEYMYEEINTLIPEIDISLASSAISLSEDSSYFKVQLIGSIDGISFNQTVFLKENSSGAVANEGGFWATRDFLLPINLHLQRINYEKRIFLSLNYKYHLTGFPKGYVFSLLTENQRKAMGTDIFPIFAPSRKIP